MAVRRCIRVMLICALPAHAHAQQALAAEVAGGGRSGALSHLPFRAADVLPLLDWSVPDTQPLIKLGGNPLAMSSAIPPAELDPTMATPVAPDWLEGIRQPDIPIRWDVRVTEMLRYFREDARGQSLMRAWIQRSGRYADTIRPVLRRQGLPEDLMYVAMVESGFNPTVQSGVGALGMWQFMPVAADDYGLQRSRWLDERLSPERSTEAAARFLGEMYARLGTWELALAAYNMGYGALLRAIRKYNTNDYWILSHVEAGLPYETVVYVAKIMACAVVGQNPERFGLADVPVDPPWDAVRVDVPGGTQLQRVARAAGMDLEALAAINPELVRQRVPPEQVVYPVRIPAAQLERFKQAWARVQPSPIAHRTYTVRFGEELADIAYMFATTTASLRRLNEIENESEIGPGYQLLVPAVEPRLPAPVPPPVATVPRQAFTYPERQRVFFTCTGRETPQGVARFFGVEIDELRRWNSIATGAALQRGMLLQVFVPKERSLSDARVLGEGDVALLELGTHAFFEYHESQRGRVRVRYRVQPGDSLHLLASRFDLSVGSIARINGFGRETQLRIDQEILLYVPENAMEGLVSEQLAVALTSDADLGSGLDEP